MKTSVRSNSFVSCNQGIRVLAAGAFAAVMLFHQMASGASIFVSFAESVQKYDEAGVLVPGFTAIINGQNGLSGLQDIAIGPDGLLYVSSTGNGKVLRYNSTTGAFVNELADVAGDPSVEIDGLTFGPDLSGDGVPDLYIADFENNKVLRVATQGAGQGVLNDFATTGLNRPIDLTFGADGKLYVASRNADQVQRYNGDGTFDSTIIATAGDGPAGITFSPDGTQLFVSTVFDNDVGQFTSAGAVLDYVWQSGALLGGPKGIVFGPDQNSDSILDLYVSSSNNDANGNAVKVFSGVDGAFIENFVTGDRPRYIAVSNIIPEPSSGFLLALGSVAIIARARRSRSLPTARG